MDEHNLPPDLQLEKSPARAEERSGSIAPNWTRVNRRQPIGDQPWTPQEKGEQDAMRDLEKPIEQLLADVHEQAFKEHAPEKWLEHLLEAHRRMVSMMARVAISSDKLNDRILCLQHVITALTVIAVVLAAVALWKQCPCQVVLPPAPAP